MSFSYHRAVAPMMWVFVAIATMELAVSHLLIALVAGRIAALVVSAVTLASIAWLVSAIAAMRRLPVTLDAETLALRVGTLRRIDVPVERIAGLVRDFDARSLKAAGVRNLALIAYPNVVVAIDPPLPGRPPVQAVAHRLDDAAAFTATIERLLASR